MSEMPEAARFKQLFGSECRLMVWGQAARPTAESRIRFRKKIF